MTLSQVDALPKLTNLMVKSGRIQGEEGNFDGWCLMPGEGAGNAFSVFAHNETVRCFEAVKVLLLPPG